MINVPLVDFEIVGRHPLATLHPAPAIIQEGLAGVIDPHFGGIGPKRSGPKLALDFHPEVVGVMFGFEVPALANAVRVCEVNAPSNPGLTLRRLPGPLADRSRGYASLIQPLSSR